MNKLIRCLGLLLVLSLLPGAAGAATTLSISSFYGSGLGLQQVTVNNPSAPGKPIKVCQFTAITPTCSVSIPASVTTVALVVATKPGFVASGGSGLCAGITGTSFQFAVAASGSCNIFAGSPMTVTANGPGVTASDRRRRHLRHRAAEHRQVLPLPVTPGSLTLTIGVTKGVLINGGTRPLHGRDAGALQDHRPGKRPLCLRHQQRAAHGSARQRLVVDEHHSYPPLRYRHPLRPAGQSDRPCPLWSRVHLPHRR